MKLIKRLIAIAIKFLDKTLVHLAEEVISVTTILRAHIDGTATVSKLVDTVMNLADERLKPAILEALDEVLQDVAAITTCTSFSDPDSRLRCYLMALKNMRNEAAVRQLGPIAASMLQKLHKDKLVATLYTWVIESILLKRK